MATVRGKKLGYILTNVINTISNSAASFHKTRQALFHCSSFLSVKGQEIKMPSLSPTMAEGKIVKWLKKEGDSINPGDVLCDIETDKAVVSMEVDEEGILAKIIVPENSTSIKVGSLIALMVSQDEDWQTVEIPPTAGVSKSDSGGSMLSTTSEYEKEDGDPGIVITGCLNTPIKMPSLSPTMTEGTIVKWLKKEGEAVVTGDVLCDIQTDKAVMSMEAEEEGILAKIIVPDDSPNVKVGTLIAVIVPEGEDWKSVTVTSKPSENKREDSKSPALSPIGAEVREKSFGPAVKSLLAAYQLEPGHIKPTGRGNRLLKEDVLKYIMENNLRQKPPKPVSAPSGLTKSISKPESILTKKSQNLSPGVSRYKDIELSNMRQIIAKRLVQSKQEVPHFYSVIKCDVDSLVKEKQNLSSEGLKVSLNDLLTKAVALALQMYPKVNSLYINNEVKLSQNIDICVAVATEKGLYTPIIKSANQKDVVNISKEVKELAGKAKNGKLKPEEFQGGTFTISNLGMFGITQFKAIINPPQCAILAVGGTLESLNSDMTVKKQMILSLSCDRRVLQENEAAEFMDILKYFMENPRLITLDMNKSMEMRL